MGLVKTDSSINEKRRKIMASIRSKDTSIEIKLRKELWKRGYRYRKNYQKLPGKPDIALTRQKIVVFCDRDFFHGKDWYTVLRPRLLKGSNPEFWEKKILRNMERDKENNLALLSMGWTVIRFWGSEIEKNTDACIAVIEECIFDQMISDNDALSEIDPDELDLE